MSPSVRDEARMHQIGRRYSAFPPDFEQGTDPQSLNSDHGFVIAVWLAAFRPDATASMDRS